MASKHAPTGEGGVLPVPSETGPAKEGAGAVKFARAPFVETAVGQAGYPFNVRKTYRMKLGR